MVSAEVLKQFGLFKKLPDSQLDKIAVLCQERTFDRGAVCFMQGKPATELHLCRSGKVDLVVQLRDPWNMEVTVHTAGPGEVFGWSALVEPRIYTASARCAEKTDEIYIRGSDLLELLEKDSRLGHTVMQNLSAVVSSRLTETRQKLAIEIANTKRTEW